MRRALIPLLPAILLFSGCDAAQTPVPASDRADTALAKGDGIAAEAALRELLRDGASRDEIAARMGEAELLQGQLAEARSWLETGVFSSGTEGHGFRMLGRLEMQAGNLPAAGRAFDQALAIMPDDASLWVDIARLRYRGGEQAQAVDAASRAIELAPDNPDALLLNGQLARDSRGMEAALPYFARALELQPDNVELLGEYAATLGEMGRAGESLAAARRMVRLDPGNPEAFYLQAVIAARGGRFDLARQLLQRSGDYGRDRPAGILLGGIIDLQQGNHASAAQSFDRLYRTQPENRQLRDLFAASLSLGGNHRELVHRFDTDARLLSASPYLRMTVARGHEALGRRAAAAPLLDRAAKSRQSNLVALQPPGDMAVASRRGVGSGMDALSLIRGQIVSGSRDAALGNARAFLARYPGSADAMGLFGDASLAAGRADAALQSYREASRIRRTWPLAKRSIAALRISGAGAEAFALGEAHLAGDPSNGELASLLGRMAYDDGNFAKARTLFDHALSHGSERDPQVHALRSLAARQAGDDAEADRFALRAVNLLPQGRMALNALSRSDNPALQRAAVAKLRRMDASAGSLAP